MFKDRELFERSIRFVALWLGLHTSDIGLTELLYVNTEAKLGISTAN